MTINLCIPTRGKPDYLEQFTALTLSNSTLDTTVVVVGVDDDDEALAGIRPNHPKIVVSVEPREDGLGEKYNRCAAARDADLYIMGLDDVAIATPGWDAILAETAKQFQSGIGVIYFGKEPHGEVLPSMMAVSRRFVDLVGFCPPYFPFWWNNSWVDEVASFVGCIFHAPIETKYPADADLPLPKRRDIEFWAEFFDATRPMRHLQANKLIDAQWTDLDKQLLARNACLRDPEFVKTLMGLPDPIDSPRHQRLRERAKFTLASVTRKTA